MGGGRMTIDLSLFRTRIATMEEAAITGSKAYKFAFMQGYPHPFWSNDLRGVTPVKLNGQTWRYDVTMILRLHRGYVTEGYDGDLEGTCTGDILTVLQYFQTYRDLTTASLTTMLNGLVPGSAAITSRGVVPLNSAPNLEIGTEYELTFSILERK